ncbi:MAG: hypothetical protein L0H31_17120, partial [Nocardioidaceae bacterium]|nr:hypothetical protein [Nocardioidaceae bacterium]
MHSAPSFLPRRLRRTAVAVGVVAVLVVLLLSHTFGRAEPTNNYRPLLPTAALETGCFPLPGGAHLDLAHQIRWDGDREVDGERRRVLKGQYDLVDREEAQRRLIEAFTWVGFTRARLAGARLTGADRTA